MIVQTDNSLDLGPFWPIPLSKELYTIVSPHRYIEISQHKWTAKKSFSKYYAFRKVQSNGRTKYIFMHRQIAHTPPNQICHHKNKNSLDNRDLNLQNMSEFDHIKFHSWR